MRFLNRSGETKRMTGRRPARQAAIGILAALVALVGLAAALPSLLLNDAALKPRIAAAVLAATGRQLTLSGPLHLWLLPSPTIVADNVALANRPGGSARPMVTLRHLSARIAWRPLLARQIQIEELNLSGPDILLEAGADGVGNWNFTPPPGPAPVTTPASPTPAKTALPVLVGVREMRLSDGYLTLRSGPATPPRVIELSQMTLTAEDEAAPLAVAGKLRSQGVALDIAATGGTLAALRDHNAPWPLNVTVAAQGARLNFQGSVADPMRADGLDVKFSATVPDVLAFSSAASGMALPRLTNVTASGRLRADRPGSVINVTDLHLAAPQGELTGEMAFSLRGRPKLVVRLAASRLDLDALPALVASPQPAVPAASAAPAAPAPASRAWLIPDRPLPFSALNRGDADVTLSVAALHWRKMAIGDFALHLVAENGKLVLNPVSGSLADGHFTASLTADAGPANLPVAMALHGTRLPLAQIWALAGATPDVNGPADLAIDVTGAGATPHAIAGTLSGQAWLTVVDGQVDTSAVIGLLGDAARQIGLKPGQGGASGQAALSCLALRATMADGTARIDPLLVDSPALQIAGEGSVALGAETLDLHLRPLVRLGGTGVMVPAELAGPWRAPRIRALGPAGDGKGISLLLGALTRPASAASCAPALAGARGEPAPPQAPPASAPEQRKPPNARDLLQLLLSPH
jgi:uncharacterized protein involved in outer membrane biogenesis